nr:hypothetical protein CFP56_70511 [Quercus suber]
MLPFLVVNGLLMRWSSKTGSNPFESCDDIPHVCARKRIDSKVKCQCQEAQELGSQLSKKAEGHHAMTTMFTDTHHILAWLVQKEDHDLRVHPCTARMKNISNILDHRSARKSLDAATQLREGRSTVGSYKEPLQY